MSNERERALEACPFCGQPGKAEGPDPSIAAEIYYVGCRQGCVHFRGPLEWATKQWNRRSHPGWREGIEIALQSLQGCQELFRNRGEQNIADMVERDSKRARALLASSPPRDAKLRKVLQEAYVYITQPKRMTPTEATYNTSNYNALTAKIRGAIAAPSDEDATAERVADRIQKYATDKYLASSPPPSCEAMINGIVRDVAELPDRTSPEDQPDMMLVTAEELTNIIRAALVIHQPTGNRLRDALEWIAEDDGGRAGECARAALDASRTEEKS